MVHACKPPMDKSNQICSSVLANLNRKNWSHSLRRKLIQRGETWEWGNDDCIESFWGQVFNGVAFILLKRKACLEISWQEQCICNMSERAGIKDKHSSGVKMSSGVGTSTNEDPVHAVLLRNSESECENALWGYDKTADRLFGRVKKAWRRRGENIYWSYSGMTVLNLEKRRPCPAFTFTLNQIVKRKSWLIFQYSLCFKHNCKVSHNVK